VGDAGIVKGGDDEGEVIELLASFENVCQKLIFIYMHIISKSI
jgi:hypothetical protein